jgi:hypothetical protein
VIVLTAKLLTNGERDGLKQCVLSVIEKLGLDRETLIGEIRAALQTYRGESQRSDR